MTKYAKKAKSNSKKGSKSFWNAIKPFFTNRGIITNDGITLKENGVLKNDPKETTEVFVLLLKYCRDHFWKATLFNRQS